MRKQAAKAVIITSVFMMFAALLYGVSFYYRGLPHYPEPEAGRIYPLNDHGYLLYMTHREKVQEETSLVVVAGLFVITALTDHFLDPFERAKSQPKSTKQ